MGGPRRHDFDLDVLKKHSVQSGLSMGLWEVLVGMISIWMCKRNIPYRVD